MIDVNMAVGCVLLLVGMFLMGSKLMEYIPFFIDKQWQADFEHFEAKEVVLTDYKLSNMFKGCVSVLATCVLMAIYFTKGVNVESIAFSLYFIALFILVGINLKHLLLPDVLTISLIWSGLLFHAYHQDNINHYLYGAVIAFLILYVLNGVFKFLKGKEIIGGGDVKLVTAMGAWFGLESLALVFVLYFALGLMIGLLNSLLKNEHLKGSAPIFVMISCYLYFVGSVF